MDRIWFSRLGSTCCYFNALMGINAIRASQVLSEVRKSGGDLYLLVYAGLLAVMAYLAWTVANLMLRIWQRLIAEKSGSEERLVTSSDDFANRQADEIRRRCHALTHSEISAATCTLYVLSLIASLLVVMSNSTSFADAITSAFFEDRSWVAYAFSLPFLLFSMLPVEFLSLKMMEKLQIALAVCRVFTVVLIITCSLFISSLEEENQEVENSRLMLEKKDTGDLLQPENFIIMFSGFLFHIALPVVIFITDSSEQQTQNTTAISVQYIICLCLGVAFSIIPSYISAEIGSLANSDTALSYLVTFSLQWGPAIIAMLEVNCYWWVFRTFLIYGCCTNNGDMLGPCVASTLYRIILWMTVCLYICYTWMLYLVYRRFDEQVYAIMIVFIESLIYLVVAYIFLVRFRPNMQWGDLLQIILLAALAVIIIAFLVLI